MEIMVSGAAYQRWNSDMESMEVGISNVDGVGFRRSGVRLEVRSCLGITNVVECQSHIILLYIVPKRYRFRMLSIMYVKEEWLNYSRRCSFDIL